MSRPASGSSLAFLAGVIGVLGRRHRRVGVDRGTGLEKSEQRNQLEGCAQHRSLATGVVLRRRGGAHLRRRLGAFGRWWRCRAQLALPAAGCVVERLELAGARDVDLPEQVMQDPLLLTSQ